jgi:mono/diheme cytochrome c family protein
LDALGVLTLVGLALFAGGLFLRRLPGIGLVIGAVIVGFGLGIPAIVIDDNREEGGAGGGGGTAAAESGGEAGGGEEAATGEEGSAAGQAGGGAAAEGRLIFTQTCGTCHVLSDAGTSGQIGPSLDTLKPNKARVAAAIENGGTGGGQMPAGLLAGKEAETVAEYVSSVAGQ